MYIDGRCYQGNSTLLTHDEAADSCVEQGSYLATLGSSRTHLLLEAILKFSTTSRWIGLEDINSGGTFQWIDGSDVNYLNFNGTAASRTECIIAGSEGTSFWTYANCSNTYSFICSAGGMLLFTQDQSTFICVGILYCFL